MQRIQSFDEWADTPRGKETVNLRPFKSLPQKHYQYLISRFHEAYEAGCTAVQMTMVEEDRLLSPPEEPEPE